MIRLITAAVSRVAFGATTRSFARASAEPVRRRGWRTAAALGALAVGGSVLYTMNTETPKAVADALDDSLPKYKYIIVGGGTAAHFATLSIREKDPDSNILVVSSENDAPYPRPPLSKYLWFQPLPKDKHRIFYYPGQAYKQPNTTLLLNTAVTGLNVDRKEVTLSTGERMRFDKVLLAMGGRPKTLADVGVSVPDECKNDFSTFRTRRDFEKLYQLSREGKTITVIGGGLLGSEITVALMHMSRVVGSKGSVHQVFPETGVLGLYLPNYLSSYTTLKLQSGGVDVRPRTTVARVSRAASGRVLLELTDGTAIETDHIVTALGIRCNNEIARAAGLEIDSLTDGIKVNAELEARRDVFAAGDICAYYDGVLGVRRVEHQDHAEFSGMRAGANMTGERTSYTYQSLCWSSLGDIRFEACGIVDPSLETVSRWTAKNEGEAPGQPGAPQLLELDPYRKGVIYYMRNKKVVGVLLWNVRDQGDRARALLSGGRSWTSAQELSDQITL